MDRKVWWIAAGLLALAGLAGPVASAQNAQTVNVELTGAVIETPDELPGVYEAAVEAEVQASGGQCLCQETSVDLQAAEVPSAVQATVFSPRSFVVDWTSMVGASSVTQESRVSIGVADIPEDTSLLSLTVTADVESNNQLVKDEVQPTQLALPIPADNATSTEDEATSTSTDEADGDDADEPASAEDPTAVVSSAEASTSEEGLDGVTLGTGAGMAGLALAGLAVRRVR